MQRLIIQMAQGVDHTGTDPARAAEKGVKRALSQANLPFCDALGISEDDVLIRLSVGLPDGMKADKAALAALNKLGRTEVVLGPGGLLVEDADTGARQIVASVAAEVFVPLQTGWQLHA